MALIALERGRSRYEKATVHALEAITLRIDTGEAGADERTQQAIRGDGRFTTADARIKLKRRYPKIQA